MSGCRLVRTAGEIGSPGGIFVPTMGGLHEGHASLVRQAVALRDAEISTGLPRRAVIVSIFINRTQFNDSADYNRYPKTLESDFLNCQSANADCVYAPDQDEIYPPGQAVPVPPLPAAAAGPGLEDALRTGHFAGVCQVVKRLFQMVQPSAAIFGEKDWQQLTVISAMTLQQQLPVEIIPGQTIRESDGLAMSSRNRFLSASERTTAPAIFEALTAAAAQRFPAAAEELMRRVLTEAGLEVQYAVVRDAETLLAVRLNRPARVLIACKLGSIRLIDNAPWSHSLSTGNA